MKKRGMRSRLSQSACPGRPAAGFRSGPSSRGKRPGQAVARAAAFLCMALVLFTPAEEALAKGGGGGSGGMNMMVAITPMPIAIIHKSRVMGILMVEIYLEAPGAAEVDKIHQLMPRLLDAYRTGLNQFTAHELRLDRPVNLARLEIYLNRETRNVLGNKDVHVIYKQVMVQKR